VNQSAKSERAMRIVCGADAAQASALSSEIKPSAINLAELGSDACPHSID